MNTMTKEGKQRIVNDIEKLKKKKYFIDILKIIIRNNPNLKISENKNGTFLFFDNLSIKTYEELDKYLEKIKANEKIIEKPDIFIPLVTTESETLEPKLRYSNRERTIIKKKLYNKVITSQNKESNDFVIK